MDKHLPTAAPNGLLDGVAVSASLVCLVHCLALPVLVASLPALGLLATHEALVHWTLLALAVPVGLFALGRGRHAAGPVPLLVGLSGFGLMAAGVGLFHDSPLETSLTVVGVMLVAIAHTANWVAARGQKQHLPPCAPDSPSET